MYESGIIQLGEEIELYSKKKLIASFILRRNVTDICSKGQQIVLACTGLFVDIDNMAKMITFNDNNTNKKKKIKPLGKYIYIYFFFPI